jgi:peptidoglycan/LPS O-acetylase OafA/YrhL
VEEHFYFLFPWLYLLMRRRRASHSQEAAVLVFLCAAILAWRCWLVFHVGAASDRTYLASDTRFDSILFGCLLAVRHNPILDGHPPGSPALWKYVLFPLGVALLLFSFLYRGDAFRESFRYTVQGVGLYPVFVTAICHPTFLPFRFLNLRPVAFIGVLSYSLYLVHHVVIFGVGFHLPQLHPVARGVLSFAIAFAISWGIYVVLEKPLAKLRKRLSV